MAELNILNNKGILILKDEFSISETKKTKDLFIEALTKAEELEIRLQGDLKFDVAFLQLLYSAISAYTELGMKVTLCAQSKETIHQILKESGFTQLNSIEILQEV